MTKLTIDIPDALIEQLALERDSLQEILPKALVQYLENQSAANRIAQTQTWKLCGALTLDQSEPAKAGKMQEAMMTNDAEHIDELLYNGF